MLHEQESFDFDAWTPPTHDCSDYICKHGECWMCATYPCDCVE